MKILIVYHYRLGDIIRMFPVARHYAAQGHQVFIECQPNYWGIFDSISYAKPVAPFSAVLQPWQMIWRPQIWPERYEAFRASGLPWMDFIYGLYPEWQAVDRRIVFDQITPTQLHRDVLKRMYSLPDGFQAIFPFSYSSKPVTLDRLFYLAAEEASMDYQRTLLFMQLDQKLQLERMGYDGDMIRCPEVKDLPGLIAAADAVLTVNTATTIIASAVRDQDRTKARYFHVREANHQDNHTAPNQTSLNP